ncbi:MAG: peptide ABC transporter substrate-binding protein [Opitutaceae bacterium]|nr:peptide ABC transporter substrate-binding protein [Opitutaceae bacterium]
MSPPRHRASGGWALLLLSLTALFAGCTPQAPENTNAILRISQRNEPADLDPATASLPDEFFIIRALGEGLVTPSPDGGAPQPAAAVRWEISPDGLRYTFHLRPAARWSNGEPVTAQDFVASYHRLLTPATGAPKAALFSLVQGADDFLRGKLTDFAAVGFYAADAHTLVVTLHHPAPQFLAYVASGPWIPVNPRVVARFGRNWTRPENFVGNGPFTLTEWRPHQRIIATRRADYWDATAVQVEAIHFLAYDNGDAEERAFRAGQLDVTMAVPLSKLAGYAAAQPSPLHRVPLHETRFLAFNTRRPALADVRVRRALSLALDRDALVTHVLQDGPTVARHFVPDGLGGFRSTTELGEAAADPSSAALTQTEARRLLAAAGFPAGVGFPTLELSGWSQTPVLEAVQAMWKKTLGIEVRIAVREARVHIATLQNGDYDIGFITAIPDVADAGDLLKDLRTGAPLNYAQWSDAAYDALLARANLAADANARLALLAQAEARLTEACPVAPLYFNAKNFLLRPGVQGWREDALWTRFYKHVSSGPSP